LLTDELKVSRGFPFGLGQRLESIDKSVGCHHPPREIDPFKSSPAPGLFPPAITHPSLIDFSRPDFLGISQPCLSDLGPQGTTPFFPTVNVLVARKNH
jgi:hypothetical protein